MVPLHVQMVNATLRRMPKRLRFPLELMLVRVRWYTAYPLRLGNVQEMMAERGVLVDPAAVHRWGLKMLPLLAKITIDKNGANTAEVRGIIADSGAPIELRQCKYLNNLAWRARSQRTYPS